MTRFPRPPRLLLAASLFVPLFAALASQVKTPAEKPVQGSWIWYPETPADKTSRYFRKSITIDGPVDTALFHFSGDDFAFLHVNGKPASPAGFGISNQKYNLSRLLSQGENILAIKVNNSRGDAGLLGYGEIILQDRQVLKIATDASWKTTDSLPPESETGNAWHLAGYDDSGWLRARIIADAASGPWRNLVQPALYKDQGHPAGPRPTIPPANLGRVTIDDFSDTSSWMGGPSHGGLPGSNNPFPFSFGTAAQAQPDRDDRHSGEFVFHFVAPDGRARFEKNSALLLKVVPEAITFDANPLGHEAEVHFEFLDKRNNRRFSTTPVKISGDTWRRHRLVLDATTVRDYDEILFPIALRNLFITVKNPAEGRILIDDLAYEVDVTRHGGPLEARPNYTTIAHAPNTPITLSYRVRNRQATPRTTQATLAIFDAANRQIGTHRRSETIPGNALKNVAFTVTDKGLPIGPYRAELRFDFTEADGPPAHFGWLGVFVPNGRRLNTTPMWFGIEDQEIRNAPAETARHVSWMRALGIDLARSGMIGSMIEGVQGNRVGVEGYAKQLAPFFDANIDILMEYAGGVPLWTHPLRADGRHHTRWDAERFRQHMAHIARFIAAHPGIKYFEFLNEPDLPAFSNLSVTEYLANLRIVYETLKADSPTLKVTTGGVAIGHPRAKPDFDRIMFQEGKPWYDVAAFHAHNAPDEYKHTLDEVKNWLAPIGDKIPFGNTEAGFRSHQGTPALFIKQADALVRKITLSKTAGAEFYVWFMLQDYWDKYLNADDSFGLVTVDNQPKPSFIAYNELIRQLANTRPAETPASLDPRVETHHFIGDQDEVLVCWPRVSGSAFDVSIKATAPVTLTDLWGAQRTLTPVHGLIHLNLSDLPVYLRAPRGAVSPVAPLVSTESDNLVVPGETRLLAATVNNSYPSAIRGSLRAGNATFPFSLPPAGTARIEVPVSIPADAPAGPNRLVAEAQVETPSGTQLFSGDVLIPYDVGLAVKTATHATGSGSGTFTLAETAHVRELAFDPTTPRWSGPDDLSTRVQVSRDNRGLRFEIVVRDQDIAFPASGVNIWQNDALQIAFLNAAGQHFELAVSRDGATSAPLAWCHIAPDESQTGRWEIPARIDTEAGKIIYRFLIPFEKIGVPGNRGDTLRMSLLVADNDGGKRLRVMEWGGGIEGGKRPELFQWLRLD